MGGAPHQAKICPSPAPLPHLEKLNWSSIKFLQQNINLSKTRKCDKKWLPFLNPWLFVEAWVFSIEWTIFLSIFLDVKRMSVNSFFLRLARLWSFLPIECFSFTYDLNGIKSRINRHFINCRFFLNRFPLCFNRSRNSMSSNSIYFLVHREWGGS